MAKYHKIWQVLIASHADGPGAIFLLPVRRTYLIESSCKNGMQRITKKALAMAVEDGIDRPVISGMEWINRPSQLHE